MTLGTWSPEHQAPTEPTPAQLRQAAEVGRNGAEQFPREAPAELEALQPWMRQPRQAWKGLLEPLATDQLVGLVRFFTLAEQHWAGWEGDDKNPVVWLCKELKRRDAFPDADLIHWIKSHTENRYLPYGNPLA